MISIVTGSFILSLLHAAIPNHWLPVIAIGRREQWESNEVLKVTFITAIAHGLSTILLGFLLSYVGATLSNNIEYFTHWVGPVILVVTGLVFIYRHHVHKHFHVDTPQKKISKTKIIIALATAMFFSPCLEIEAYFLMAGTYSWWLTFLIAAMYLVITVTGMLFLSKLAYNRILKLNWHALEHNAGIITGITLVATGIFSFFIH